MVLYTLLRGFRVAITTLDAFLEANNVDETDAIMPIREGGPIDQLLRAKSGSEKTRIFIPCRRDHNHAHHGYVAYDWLYVYAQRRIHLESELLDTPPPGFAALRDEIMSFSPAGEGIEASNQHDLTGFFATVTDERYFDPQELIDRERKPITCDQCDDTFAAWRFRQSHRIRVHGSTEGENELPENA